MTSAAALPVDDYIEAVIGSIKFAYYGFLHEFHVRPLDMDDFVDGICYMMAYNYQKTQEYKQAKEQAANDVARRAT